MKILSDKAVLSDNKSDNWEKADNTSVSICNVWFIKSCTNLVVANILLLLSMLIFVFVLTLPVNTGLSIGA